MGQGAQTSLAQIVAEELGLPAERVVVSFADTELTPYDMSTSSSRTTFSMGHAARAAAGQIREQLLQIGAQALEARPDDLELVDSSVRVKGMIERRRTIPQLFQTRYGLPAGSLLGGYDFLTTGGLDADTSKGKASAFFFLSAAAAEVEVDTETGKVRVIKVATSVDVGKAINPLQCRLQDEGSMLTALGTALFEEMVFDGGQPVNATFLDYMPPSMEDHPAEFRSLAVETPHPEGPFGAKGSGEAAIATVAPAIANAVANALGGARIKDMPMHPERVLAAIEGYQETQR
jgi:carbon-monoxide dehydrogenase large subunit